jgi:hypothetical protein
MLVHVRCLVLVLTVACGGTHAPREAPTAAPTRGITIAIYRGAERGYGVVDDRRTVEVAGGTILLDRIDPGAALASLVIESLGEPRLRVTSCVRERIDDSAEALAQLAEARGQTIVLRDMDDAIPERFQFEEGRGGAPAAVPDPAVLSPLVRCRVAGRDGKYFVRVLHVTSAFAFDTRHDLVMTEATRAIVTTRFAFVTPPWLGQRARLSLFEGVPGDQTPPRALATESVILDGSTSILAGAPRAVAAQLRAIYDGIALDDDVDTKPDDIVWGRASHHRVWQWLELAVPLARGPVRAHVEAAGHTRDLEIAAAVLEHGADDTTRVPLWIDEDLLGTRTRTIERADGVTITDRLQLAVANLGEAPREVWIEERLRMPKPRRFVMGRERPQIVGDRMRFKLSIAPGKTERVGFTVDYDL